MATIIRRVAVPAGETVKVIPPDSEEHQGIWAWQVVNPAGSAVAAELVDDAGKTVGDGLPLAVGAEPWRTYGRDVQVFAAVAGGGAAGEVVVTGTPDED